MNIIQLHHDASLSYPAERHLLSLLPVDLSPISIDHPVITFRRVAGITPRIIHKQVNACSRFLNFPQSDLVFAFIESDSPLAPLILWDAAHQLPLNARITLIENHLSSSYLERDYFKKSFTIEERSKEHIVLRKIAPLSAELDAGLTRWSFCIPTGPGDATGLNVVVKRILELEIPEKEILLCGRPGDNFHYWDQVRIVGEDIPAPPIWITKKKNVLVQEARFENVCLLHDRVFLPRNFMKVMHQFGDYYSFAAFQSLWFDDRLNFSSLRYSDYGCAANDHVLMGASVDKNGEVSSFTPSLYAEVEKQNFKNANPLRYQQGSYLTGSLYIVKRQVWLSAPQNEKLFWSEFEDIEQAYRCQAMGIPHRIIPGAFTQSLFARPLLYFAGYSSYFSANGSTHSSRKLIPLPTCLQKPLIKLSEKDAEKRLIKFVQKYAPDQMSKVANENHFFAKFFLVIRSVRLPFQKTVLKEFINDIERDVLCDQMGLGTKQWLLEQFAEKKTDAKLNLTTHYTDLANQFAQRPHGRRFYKKISDYFPKRSCLIKLGSFFSAIRLSLANRDYAYHPDGLKGYYQAILDSTPFIDYVEK